MIRTTFFLVIVLLARLQEKETPQDPQKSTIPVVKIESDSLAAFSAEKGKAVIGTLADESGNGHVVVLRPGTDRVYDGNTLGGFKDLLDKKSVSNEYVVKLMNNFIREQFPKDTADILKAKPEQMQKYLDRYIEKGAPLSHSWRSADLEKVQWFQVPSDKDLKTVAKEYQPPKSETPGDQNRRCNDFLKNAAPVVSDLVHSEVAPPKGQKAPDVTANNIDRALHDRLKEEIRLRPVQPPVERPPEPRVVPVFENKSREQPVVPKPGGVIIAAEADFTGLPSVEVASASFDERTGLLSLVRKAGGAVQAKLDPDDFAVAVKSVFERGVDPSLSMTYSDKPGYHAVNYCGPLFQTRFGKVLYETDSLLGKIIFNREGPHRSVAADHIPGFAGMACESYATMSRGSRVFLRAFAVHFVLEGNRILPKRIETKVDVEGLDNAADYYQESLHRLARAIDLHFDALADNFDELQEFRQLAVCVALAKWLKANGIPFDRSALVRRSVTSVEFPAYSPTSYFSCLFNGRSLDGWKMASAAELLETTAGEESLSLKAVGDEPVELFHRVWRNDYDLRYNVITDGPIEFVLRNGDAGSGASVTIDTGKRAGRVELFMAKGEWTAVCGSFGEKGKVVIPEPVKGEPRKPSEFGIRIPKGSRVELYSALLRLR